MSVKNRTTSDPIVCRGDGYDWKRIECGGEYLGDKLASVSLDKTIKTWNMATGQCERTLEGHTGGVWVLAARANGTLASGSADTTIKIWGDWA